MISFIRKNKIRAIFELEHVCSVFTFVQYIIICVTSRFFLQVYQDQHGCGGDTVFYTYKLFAGFMLTSLRLQQDDRDMLSAIKSLNQ